MSSLLSSIVVLSAVLLLLVAPLTAQDGWKMTDRFFGFRYSMSANPTGAEAATEAASTALVKLADEFGCFGWVQHPVNSKTLVSLFNFKSYF